MTSNLMMRKQSLFFCFGVFFAAFSLLLVPSSNVQADSQGLESIGAMWDGWKNTTEKGIEDTLIGWHYY